ncbi:alpha/beta hydrolase [Streptomyces armeniacus]|uniref:Alpha/beta hydrolase n=1 Tax=Streptomyces armeniacus TaxID=83291 RepID=A0A345XLA7_9ACTN|nr:alpha/beta hydrolase [Streptomyces armeniacus]AXK32423.1 alpha/beta hydrolase [Streptomyces armeniacus]
MNDLAELKQFVIVHARSQKIKGYRELLARIRTDAGDGTGSWAGEWTRAGDALRDGGRHLEACRHYAMARFPYVDGPGRQRAQDSCAEAFDVWRAAHPGVERLDLDLPDGRVRCWTSGLSAAEPRPLLVVMGGIVSVKEQWGPVLARIGRLGMAGVVTELPGVGENTLRYGGKSWQMLSSVLDAVGERADVSQTYAMTLSFSGHMALRCAVDDSRIRGVVTTGAPVSEFFTDAAWQDRIPRVTVDTLAHMSGREPADVRGGLAELALTDGQLAALDIPLRYVASSRDEIIPAAEAATLPRRVKDVRLLVHDDVHGSPRHVAETQLWCLRSLFEIRGVRGPQSAALGLLLGARRLQRRLAAPGARARG